jgi:transposase
MPRVIEDGEDSVDTTCHMSGRMTARVEIIGRVSGRLRWTVEQKLSMLRVAFGSGGCVRTAMERHEVSSGQLYTWRNQAMSGELTGMVASAVLPPLPEPMPCFAEVAIAKATPLLPAAVLSVPAQVPSGQIGIELSCGGLMRDLMLTLCHGRYRLLGGDDASSSRTFPGTVSNFVFGCA